MAVRSTNLLEPSLLGVVLCGGLSSRLGQNKAKLALNLGAPTILERTYGILKECLVNCVLMGRDTLEDERTLSDHCPRIGPIGGIITALYAARKRNLGGILALPCDMPFLDPKVIKELIRQYQLSQMRGANFCQFVWCERDSLRQQNLTAIYLTEAIHFFEESIAQGEYALNRVIPKDLVQTLMYDKEYAKYFYNINTQRDLEKARAMLNDSQ